MPASYLIDRAERLIRFEAHGHVTAQELMRIQDQLLADPDFDETYAELCDFRDAHVAGIDTADIQSIAERSPSFRAARGRRAIVADAGVSFGLARMFEAYANMRSQPTHVFDRIDDAIAWLAED